MTDKEDLQLTTVSYGNEKGVDNPAFVKEDKLEDDLSDSDKEESESESKSWLSKACMPITAAEIFCKAHSKIIKYIALGIFAAGYVAYFIAACYLDFKRAVALVVLTCLGVFIIVSKLVNKYMGDRIKRFFKPAQRCLKSNMRWIKWVFIVIVLGLLVAWLVIDTRNRPEQLISFAGVCLFIIAIFLFSAHKTAVSWRTVFWGLGLQFAIGLFIIRTDPGFIAFDWLGKQVQIFLDYTKAGSGFVFGEDLIENVFAFQALPIVVFFSSVMSVLYYLGVMQWVITKISWVMQLTMGTSSTETLSVAGNIFVGQTEAPLLIRPYLKDMTKSEIHAVMTGGFATIAGSVMGAFISFGIDASSLISASVMAAPCALAISKLSYPETEKSKFKSKSQIKVDTGGEQNVLEAVSNGASASIGLVANIAANLIAFLAILGFINATLKWLGGMVGYPDVSFELICSYVFMPVAFMMGIPYDESFTVAELIGTKLFLNEFIAYEKLAGYKNNRLNGILEETVLSVRSEIICTYALCGFANFSSLGIVIGGLSSICPSKKGDISALVLRALFTGTCVSLINACIAGILFVPPIDCVDLFQNTVFNTTVPNLDKCCKDLFESTINNGTISFEGSWSGVKNATIYLANCCDLYETTVCI
ncbi:sodium/nucleoside cotransporter 1 isoform X1 [Pimephales promelas]|uniref:sodium/nucleoside cotransporter 1 isoform X1 n=2 Tax=Pimephales promelas TaxID=90988 RepID=UPI0019558D68|nr:sodium/nucleoside cotransporter 1 isoform X1 [Pimephales promelas]KAG1944853.1 sodium/nucleoside cotransporter [Pimephales promelas]KAG1944854.1 sodium/nucleoside cotransporter [Pimephales promelas]